MKKIFCLTTLFLCCALLSADDYQPEIDHSQIGRYQMVSVSSETTFLLDTTNGQVWKLKGKFMSSECRWKFFAPALDTNDKHNDSN